MRRLSLTLAVPLFTSLAGAAAAQGGACPDTIPSDTDSLVCACPAGTPDAAVWGSGPYTADSDICTAAVHAGAVAAASGGEVSVRLAPGAESYSGSAANGVTTRDWGAYGVSIEFQPVKTRQADLPACESYPVNEERHACACGPVDTGGAVWGSGPYTSDSALCTAALHAGVIGPGGGAVVAVLEAGLSSYSGSDANGVTTRDWGGYGSSFSFEAPSAMAIPAGMEACGAYPASEAVHSCGCAPGEAGAVWGSGPYTADSNICSAALHAGVIGEGGGPVTAMAFPGLESYLGSARNGVETMDWGAYELSIIFDGNREY